MKSNFRVVEATDDHYVLFNNVTDTELIFDDKYRFVKGARVIENQVFDCLATYDQTVECAAVIFDFVYEQAFGDKNEDGTI